METIAWTSWPLRDDFPRSLVLGAVVVVCSIGIGITFESVGLGLFSFAVLAVSVLRYVVPTRYALDESGVVVRFVGQTKTRPWSEFRAFYPHRDGVHLSPFSRPSPLDPFRGIYLRFAGNRDEVLAFVSARIGR